MSIRILSKKIYHLIRQPLFIAVTVIGNSVILIGSLLMFFFEHGINPKLNSLLDAFWWSIATVTTVGYGDISPITHSGKLVGIAMMIIGTALFWTYTALVASAVVSEEISELELDLHNLNRTLSKLEKSDLDHSALQGTIQRIENTLTHLKKKNKLS